MTDIKDLYISYQYDSNYLGEFRGMGTESLIIKTSEPVPLSEFLKKSLGSISYNLNLKDHRIKNFKFTIEEHVMSGNNLVTQIYSTNTEPEKLKND